jgi:hypothetical protein
MKGHHILMIDHTELDVYYSRSVHPILYLTVSVCLDRSNVHLRKQWI